MASNVIAGLADKILTYEHLIEKENINKRFVTTSEEEEMMLITEQRNKNTDRKTKSDVKVFTDYLRAKGEMREAHVLAPAELDKFIANFLISVRKEGNEEYEPESLTSKFNSIGRHLRENGYKVDIKTSLEFDHSRRVLGAKRKQLKGTGKGNKTKKAAAIEDHELSALKAKGLLSTGTPQGLLNSVWLVLTQQFGLRSVTPQANMTWGDVELKMDSAGNEYLEYTERTTKTRTGQTRDCRPFAPKAFANQDSDMCPVLLYKAYRSHRPATCLTHDSRMFLQPLPIKRIKDNIWYSRVPMGKNSLGNIVKEMYAEAGLGGRHTNHSARRTMITAALEKGVHETKLMQISGHKNVQSLNEYRTISMAQQKQISTLLSGAMADPPSTSTSQASVVNQQHNSLVRFDDFGISDEDLMTAVSPQMRSSVKPNDANLPCCIFRPSSCTFNGPVVIKLN